MIEKSLSCHIAGVVVSESRRHILVARNVPVNVVRPGIREKRGTD